MSDRHPLTSVVLDMDATALVEAYKKGKIKPGKAVEIYINHQERFNKTLNLVVENRYEAARKEAAQCDTLLEKGAIEGKLFGVPISMKEAFDVADMNTTGGLTHFRDRVRKEDAEVVKRLRKEGAIILGKTNTPSLCFCQETDNRLFGRSNNPWNPKCTTGGSSGGEAGVIAVGGAAAGFGSDIGGSIRIPSHFNGVVGFKAGASQYPMAGHFPEITLDNQKNMLGYGPIVKTVRDAALLYSIIHPSFQPPESWELPEKLKVVSFGSFHKTRCTAETVETLEKAQEALTDEGATLNQKVPGFMNDIALYWQLTMSEDGAKSIGKLAYPHLNKWKRFDYLKILFDYLEAKLGLKVLNHPYLSWGIFGARIFTPDEEEKEEVNEFIQTHLEEVKELLGQIGVFLIPVYPSPAKKHGRVYGDIFCVWKNFRLKPFQWKLPFISLPNALGLPAMVVPCGRSEDGMPIGLQVVSSVGNEELVFRVASFLESRFGGYSRNNKYD